MGKIMRLKHPVGLNFVGAGQRKYRTRLILKYYFKILSYVYLHTDIFQDCGYHRFKVVINILIIQSYFILWKWTFHET